MSADEENKIEPESEDEEVKLKVPVKEAPVKPAKAKRVMTPEMLEALANARKKAFEVKTANAKIRAENKKVLVKQITEEQEVATKEKIKKSIKPKPLPVKEVVEEIEEEEEEPPVVKKKSVKKKKKPVVVIEESDSSSDDNSNVIYIKRRSKKPLEQTQAVKEALTLPPPVVRQEISAFDRQQMLQRAALRMF